MNDTVSRLLLIMLAINNIMYILIVSLTYENLSGVQLRQSEKNRDFSMIIMSRFFFMVMILNKHMMNKIARKYLVLVVCQAPHLEMGSLPKVSS